MVLEHQYDAELAGGGLGQVISDYLGGRTVRPDDALRALGDLLGGLGMHPRVPGDGVWAPGGGRTSPWPPRPQQPRPRVVAPDPEVIERQRILLRARQELGFQPREPLTRDVVERRRKELARRHHPDLGGSVQRMASINQAADVLLETADLR